MTPEHHVQLLAIADTLAVGGAIASLVQWLPPLAAGLSCLWLGTRLYEYGRWVSRGRKGKEGP